MPGCACAIPAVAADALTTTTAVQIRRSARMSSTEIPVWRRIAARRPVDGILSDIVSAVSRGNVMVTDALRDLPVCV
jgi:hypothetical protein